MVVELKRHSPFTEISITPKGVAEKAALAVVNQLKDNPYSIIGLPTGDTPVAMYEELERMYNDKKSYPKLDFSKATFFNLDEYVGLNKDDPESYASYMREKFFDRVGIKSGQTKIPDGKAKNLSAECDKYDGDIASHGGIDLLVLGIGPNGHIGFCEPGTSFDKGTHVAELSEETRKANAKHFGGDAEHFDMVPKEALTMGPKTIMGAKKIILLATGKAKMEPVYKALTEEVTENLPASILQRHPAVTFYVDGKAAKGYEETMRSIGRGDQGTAISF